ncbi:MAG: hypothetical protein P0121_08190 [Nitrospira sp.]|nr:hypothetical protein [Nitrospira sp.]
MNGEQIGLGRCEQTVAGRFGLGEDTGTPVTPDYKPPFKFTGKIEKVTIDLMPMSAVVQADGDPVTERERVMRSARE